MAEAPDPVPRSIGRYVLHGEIAAGGMATVHFGRLVGPAGFSRPVAIKRLHPQFARDPEFVAMFIDEARLAARISHTNVVPTLDVVAIDSELFLVMEYVRGAPLSRLIRAACAHRTRIPVRVATSIVTGVLHGLHAAHEARDEMGQRLEIVHRDVSPQNVLVGTDGIARVLDFGVAKAAGRAQTTRDGQLKGKLGYMAPEQLRGARASRQSDVFAASVVLWEVLTGQRLFKADDDAGLLAKVLATNVPAPSKLVDGIPRALEEVVLRGTASDPAARYATAHDMARALEAAMAGAPLLEVGEWVTAHAADELTERAARVAEIERSSGSLPDFGSVVVAVSSDVHTSVATPNARKTDETVAPPRPESDEERPARKTRRTVIALLLAIGVGATAAIVTGRHAPPHAVAIATAAQVAAPVATTASFGATETPVNPVVAPIAPIAPIASGASGAIANAAVAPVTPTHSNPGARSSTRGSTKAPARQKPDCDPPSTTDDRGHVHFKPECFRSTTE
jgi:serine/threonine protein kinase